MTHKRNRVGLGTFPFAGVFTPISKQQVKKIVREFIENGGCYIDTAPLYGFGEVEVLLGEVLREYPRETYFIATKCGYIDVEGKTFANVAKSGKYKDVISECEKSLKRLQTDTIDLYFVHSPDPTTPFDETVKALVKLKNDGKIQRIGVSNVDIKELQEFNTSDKIEFVQNRFSLLNRSISPEFEKYMKDNSIKLVPYQVIDRGQLTGKVFEGIRKLSARDLRKSRNDWQPEKLHVISKWVKTSLSPIAKGLGITLGQLSIAWALHQGFTGFAIVGITNPEYLKVNLRSDEITLTRETFSKIDAAYKDLEHTIWSTYGQSVREFRGLNHKYY